MWVSQKRKINTIYKKIDKIAKKGRDNFQKWYDFIGDSITRKQYADLLQCLYYKYDFDASRYLSITDMRDPAWDAILYHTKDSLQEMKYDLMEKVGLYQIGITYYKQIPQTKVNVIDEFGSGAVLIPNVVNGGVESIDVVKGGQNYSTASNIEIIGGVTPSATAQFTQPNGLRKGVIIDVEVTATGSSHNRDIRLGTIEEVDYYEENIIGLSPDEYQKIIQNKKTYLSVTLEGSTQSASFSSWSTQSSYDRNVIDLYKEAFGYLI